MLTSKALITYECPHCNAGYGAEEHRAGSSQVCCNCETAFRVPVGLPSREVQVSDSPGVALTPEEEAAVRGVLSRQGACAAVTGLVADRLLRTAIDALLRRLGGSRR